MQLMTYCIPLPLYSTGLLIPLLQYVNVNEREQWLPIRTVYCSRLIFRRRLFCGDGEANDIYHQKSVEIIVKLREMHAHTTIQ